MPTWNNIRLFCGLFLVAVGRMLCPVDTVASSAPALHCRVVCKAPAGKAPFVAFQNSVLPEEPNQPHTQPDCLQPDSAHAVGIWPVTVSFKSPATGYYAGSRAGPSVPYYLLFGALKIPLA